MYKSAQIIGYFNRKLLWESTNMVCYFNINKELFIQKLFLIIALSHLTIKSAVAGDIIMAVNS